MRFSRSKLNVVPLGLAPPKTWISRSRGACYWRDRLRRLLVEFSRAKDKAPEGCLSIPGMEEVVERPSTVTVEGLSPEGGDVKLEVSGLLSRAIQHEIDHLDGILFIDRVSPLKRRLLMRKWQKSRAEEEGS